MNFIKKLPKIEGRNIVLVSIGHFSKYTHFISLTYPFIAFKVAKATLVAIIVRKLTIKYVRNNVRVVAFSFSIVYLSSNVSERVAYNKYYILSIIYMLYIV